MHDCWTGSKEDELDPKTYLTTTRGERHRPAARPAGEGVYAIARHRGHTHFVYVLELPREPGEDPPDFLDHEGAEILLIATRVGAIAELGLTLDREHETEETAAIFEDLRLEKSLHPLTPLFKGTWE